MSLHQTSLLTYTRGSTRTSFCRSESASPSWSCYEWWQAPAWHESIPPPLSGLRGWIDLFPKPTVADLLDEISQTSHTKRHGCEGLSLWNSFIWANAVLLMLRIWGIPWSCLYFFHNKSFGASNPPRSILSSSPLDFYADQALQSCISLAIHPGVFVERWFLMIDWIRRAHTGRWI